MPGHRAQKRFGQNFLVSEKIISRIIDLVAPTQKDTVVEIGPGQGALTLPMAQTGARVVGVEFDRDLIGPLVDLLAAYDRATILNQDFLKFDPSVGTGSRFRVLTRI